MNEPVASLALLRSMLTNPEAASAGIARYEAQIAQAIPAGDADLRAEIISAITLGITVSRHLIRSDELATADPAAIAELAAGPLPVAVMVWPGAPSVAELAAAGAVRISLGSAIAQAAYAVAVRAATELLTSGTYDSVAGGITYNTMNDAVTAAPGLPS